MFTIGDEQIPGRLMDSAIPPFINAMKAVEINLSVEQIKTGLVVQKLIDYQGNPFHVVVTSNTGDFWLMVFLFYRLNTKKKLGNGNLLVLMI